MKIHAPNAELVDRHDWTDGLATFSVRPTGWELPDFHPGQFTNLALPAGEDWDAETGASIRRAYSIASSPGRESMEFFTRRVLDDQGAVALTFAGQAVSVRISSFAGLPANLTRGIHCFS